MTMYEKYCQLDIESRWIGLEKSDTEGGYFCTPLGAEVIGWENSIHYCFIKGYGETVFAVNPETCVDKYVYPLASNFTDFMRLILACGSTTAAEQIVGWSKEQFKNFLKSEDNAKFPEQKIVLEKIEAALSLTPMENPYEYVKSLQAGFDDSKIEFSDEYYDILGLERPDGTESEAKLMEFDAVTFCVEKKEK